VAKQAEFLMHESSFLTSISQYKTRRGVIAGRQVLRGHDQIKLGCKRIAKFQILGFFQKPFTIQQASIDRINNCFRILLLMRCHFFGFGCSRKEHFYERVYIEHGKTFSAKSSPHAVNALAGSKGTFA